VEQRRDGERPIRFGELKDVLRVRVGRVHEVVLQMHDALRESGRAGRVEPEAHVVLARVGGIELRGDAAHRVLERLRAGRRLAAGHEDVLQMRALRADLEDLRHQRRGDDDGDRAAVVQDVRDVRRMERRVRRDRDRADLDGAVEREREGRRVDAEDRDPLLQLHAELAQDVSDAVDVRGELAVRDRPALAPDRDRAVANAAMRVDERRRGVVAVRQLREAQVGHGCRRDHRARKYPPFAGAGQAFWTREKKFTRLPSGSRK
jgi:hypothetical protein